MQKNLTLFWFLFWDNVLKCLFGKLYWDTIFWKSIWKAFLGSLLGRFLRHFLGRPYLQVHLMNPVKAGEDFGMEGTKSYDLTNKDQIIRTSKRTSGWSNEALSIRLKNKLSEELLTKIEATAPYTSVRGIHSNWRVALYRDGETFPAHIDQADSVMVEHPEKMRQRFTSSHTLLIYLRRPGEQFQGKLCSNPDFTFKAKPNQETNFFK